MDNKQNRDDETVSSSKEESLRKAMAIFEEEQRAEEFAVVRPQINGRRIIARSLLRLAVSALLAGAAYAAVRFAGVSPWVAWAAWTLYFVVTVSLSAKKACIECVLLYQRYAPERLRAACLFTPSCSEYMRISIEKYGVIKGIYKGVRRLCRCHQPNGGVDNP